MRVEGVRVGVALGMLLERLLHGLRHLRVDAEHLEATHLSKRTPLGPYCRPMPRVLGDLMSGREGEMGG